LSTSPARLSNLRTSEFQLDPPDNSRLANLCGQFDQHLRQMEQRLGVEINNRGHIFQVIGSPRSVQATGHLLRNLYETTRDETLSPARINIFLQESGIDELATNDVLHEDQVIRAQRRLIKTRGSHQRDYIDRIRTQDINFGIGPAGTGKTFLAAACAVEALEQHRVQRLILVRPAVEAGERLGFLPGDIVQKVDPYLRPLYDALYEMMGVEKVLKLLERNIIEIAPLAFMRGRSLNEAFIILDEAQNTTVEQMKMFLTRLGFGSTAVITGDITQIDLPRERKSGLQHVIKILQDVPGVSFTFFDTRDVVRHPVVARILDAYAAYEEKPKQAPSQ
jgi:phosphate starvation-inducible protein PhoH and related proteins